MKNLERRDQMIKLRYEGDSELNFWVDDDSGDLCIETIDSIIEIPYDEAVQILNAMRSDLLDYQDKKQSIWDKIWNR